MLTPNQFTQNRLGASAETKSVARQMVERLEAALAGTADPTVKSYQINNRRLDRYSVSELIQMLDYWRKRAAAENGGRCEVRFSL